MSTAATPGQAKLLYQEPKLKLCEKIQANLMSFSNIAGAINNSKELQVPLQQATKNFVGTERQINDSYENLKRLSLLHIHMNYQYDAINRMAANLEGLKEQAQSMRR